MPGFVLDTSALLTVFKEEPGADLVIGLLDETAESEEPTIAVPFMALMELDYLSRQRLGAEVAVKLCDLVCAWPVVVLESNPAWAVEAAKIKAVHALSLADSWICGLAVLRDAELVHKDPEYDQVTVLKARRLPYKRAKPT